MKIEKIRMNNLYYFPKGFNKNKNFSKKYFNENNKLNRINYNDLRQYKRNYVVYKNNTKTNIFNNTKRYYLKNDGSIFYSNIFMNKLIKRFKRFKKLY